MTRARTELALALGAALGLAIGLAWYQGPLASHLQGARSSGLANPDTAVADTTLLAGPLHGTVHEAPAPDTAIHNPN